MKQISEWLKYPQDLDFIAEQLLLGGIRSVVKRRDRDGKYALYRLEEGEVAISDAIVADFCFEATLAIIPRTWKRTKGSSRRFMTPDQRNYYVQLYMALHDAGMKPLDATIEYRLEVYFHYTTGHWKDSSNLMKALEDAGQISQWLTKDMAKKSPGMAILPDFWDDKIFREVHAYRVRHAIENKIEVRIGGV